MRSAIFGHANNRFVVADERAGRLDEHCGMFRPRHDAIGVCGVIESETANLGRISYGGMPPNFLHVITRQPMGGTDGLLSSIAERVRKMRARFDELKHRSWYYARVDPGTG